MANTQYAFGLRPVRYIGGAPYNGAVNTYFAQSDYATDLFIGDPVVVTGANLQNGDDNYQSVALVTAGATNQITGIIMGFGPNPSVVSLGYGIKSTAREVYVADDPTLLFEVMEDAVGGALAAASIGLNCDLVAGTGDTYYKKSGWMLDSSTATGGATLQCIVRSLVPRADNAVATAYAKYLVSINIHTNRYGALQGL